MPAAVGVYFNQANVSGNLIIQTAQPEGAVKANHNLLNRKPCVYPPDCLCWGVSRVMAYRGTKRLYMRSIYPRIALAGTR